MTERIGFIGVGMMGHGMAKNLLEKGFTVTAVAHRNRAGLEDLLQRGAEEAVSAGAATRSTDIVILCVTGSPQVESLVYGDDGILANCKEGQMVVDCSTSEPASTARIARDLQARGVTTVDAPLTRTPIEAEAGRLNSMVGASEPVLARVRPVLEAFCENIFHVGPGGAGHKLKLINNFFAMGQAALIAEALCACAATGVDPRKYSDVISAGAANSGIFQMLVGKAMEGDYSGLKFGLANAEKDLRYYNHLVENVPLTNSLGSAVHHACVEGLNLGFGDDFVGALIQAQARLNNQVLPE